MVTVAFALIHKFFNFAFKSGLNYKGLSHLEQKAFEFTESFQNRQVQIPCSYWIICFSELHRELFKTGQGQSCRFSNAPSMFPMNISFEKPATQRPPLLKAGQSQFRWF
jgi:hypothetical protein